MKDILITGGAGKIGYDLVEKLIQTNYSITVLDLESKSSLRKLNKYKNKIKIIFGDIEDENLIQDLIKKNDIVIDYAGIMPPLANLDSDIAEKINFNGTKNIVDAIKKCNPDCMFIYMSFISIYGESMKKLERLTVNGKINNPEDIYSISLFRSEEYIKNNLRKYNILRMPVVLTKNNYFLKHLKLNRVVDFITVNDINTLVISVMKSRKTKGKVFNISGFKINTTTFLKKQYKALGRINIINRKLYYGEYDDFDDIKAVAELKYQDFNTYLKNEEKNSTILGITLRKILNYPAYVILTKIGKK